MADLYEVLLVDRGTTWHAGFLVDDETETDVLLTEHGRTLLFGSRAALEHAAQQRGFDLEDDLPDEVDLDLDGWLSGGGSRPTLEEVSELWHLLVDHPEASRSLRKEAVEEAYDDLVGEDDGERMGDDEWFREHGRTAQRALASAVERLRGSFARPGA